jgi:hypothetical protein
MIKNPNYIFGISTRCENEEQSNLPITCVKSIREFYPDADIFIVDSDSPVNYHIEPLLELGCIISNKKNHNYEAGMIWETYLKFNRDVYIFMQDSMILKGNIDEYFTKDVTVIGEIYAGSYGNGEPVQNWIVENIEKTEYDLIDNYNMVQYNSMIIQKNVMDKLKTKKLDTALPTNKYGSCGMERLFGIALTHEGYHISESIQLRQNLIHKSWINRQ